MYHRFIFLFFSFKRFSDYLYSGDDKSSFSGSCGSAGHACLPAKENLFSQGRRRGANTSPSRQRERQGLASLLVCLSPTLTSSHSAMDACFRHSGYHIVILYSFAALCLALLPPLLSFPLTSRQFFSCAPRPLVQSISLTCLSPYVLLSRLFPSDMFLAFPVLVFPCSPTHALLSHLTLFPTSPALYV